jgi:DNA-binding transcriptional ArsR family regulator
MAARKKQGMRRRAKVAKARKGVDKGNIKAMANSLRTQVLTILNERANSTTRMAKELGVDYSKVSYEVEVLRDMGYIEVVDEVKRRGAVEVFYKATSRAHLDDLEWPAIPDTIKGGLRASLLQTLTDDAITAIEEETFDSRDGSHMSWSPLVVDEQGWEEVVELLAHALEGALKIHERSAERLVAADEKGISCTVSILGYPAAQDEKRVGKPIKAKDLETSTAMRKAKTRKAPKEKKAATKKSGTTAKGRGSKAASKAGRKDKRK